ncbi:MAG: hypothetical protein JW723_06820 [Bacteroidales bacterium]|nr:hypothetical protein [Bacteroidales bacterium]
MKMDHTYNPLLGKEILPVDIVLAPEWWHRHEKITFDRDFFFHPIRRAEEEQKMERILYEKWGKYGLGSEKGTKRPELGAVHLAAGFMLSEMIGCEIDYSDSHPPRVLTANREDLTLIPDDAFRSKAFRQFVTLKEEMKKKFGYLTGDVNWGGILNLAMDLRGNDILTDMMMNPGQVRSYFRQIAEVIHKFTAFIQSETGTSSISVNRVVKHLKNPVFLHSECSHTMISAGDYEDFLMDFDIAWSKNRPFGIHYCGPDPHRMAASFAKIPHLDFLDVGWGGDLSILRKNLPDTFLNIRLSPVEITHMNDDELSKTIKKLVSESANPYLTGICCINMDDTVTDDKINTILQTVDELKRKVMTDL